MCLAMRGKAVGAQADQRKVAEPRPVADVPFDCGAGVVQLVGREGCCFAARFAPGVLALALAGQLVESGAVPEMYVPYKANVFKSLECAIRGRHVERRYGLGRELLHRKRAVRIEQHLQECPPGGRDPATALTQDGKCFVEIGDWPRGRERGLRHG